MSDFSLKDVPTIRTGSEAEMGRCQRILRDVCREVIEKLTKDNAFNKGRREWFATRGKIEELLVIVSNRNLKKIIEAGKVKPSYIKAQEEIAEEKKKVRKGLASELKKAKNKLASLKKQIYEAQEKLDVMHKTNMDMVLRSIGDVNSSTVAMPNEATIIPHEDGEGLPDRSGIYFLWDDTFKAWVYVGKSVKLSGRLRLGNHHILKPHHMISYIEMPEACLDYVEILYMALLRPMLNFGGRLVR